jgi:hypothetical protein
MADFPIYEFEFLVHDFLLGRKSWDEVHHFVIDAEGKNATEPRDARMRMFERS